VSVEGGPNYIHTLHIPSLSLSLLNFPWFAPSYRPFLQTLVLPPTKVVNIANIANIAKMTKVANPVRSNHCKMGEITPPDTPY